MRKLLLFVLTAFVSAMNAQAQDCPRIFTKGDTLYTDPAPQYQWFRDQNPIQGATKQWYLPTKGGNFSVQISGTTPNFAYELPTVGKTVSGRIIDERYEPIADAVVSVGVNNVKSDGQGRFFLTGLDEGMTTAIVTITKDGFWKNTQRVHFFDQTIAPLTAMLEPLRITNRFDATKGATISERGFFLTFPPNSAVTEDGKLYTKTINISLKRAFPSEDGFGLRMPGGDFSAIDANGQEKMLVSYGFMSAEMNGSNGEKLKLAPNVEATLEFYIPWEQNKTAPDSMPLWHFDEPNAVWKPEGTARKVGPRYVGTVKHFSSWNCDVPRNRATVYGKVVDCKGNPVPYMLVHIGERTITTDSAGFYKRFVPNGVSFYLTAGIDTIFVDSVIADDVKEIPTLTASPLILDVIGFIDSAGVLSVYGYGVKEYSVNEGRLFYPKSTKLTLNKNFPSHGIAKDSLDCNHIFPIFMLQQKGDCQLYTDINIEDIDYYFNSQSAYRTLKSALEAKKMVNIMNLEYQIYSEVDIDIIASYFTCLKFLDLSNNHSTINFLPMSIGQLTNLQILTLSSNQEIKKLPESFGQLTNLRRLDLDGISISRLPESFGQLTNLASLNLSGNNISELPESFWQLTNLTTLDLSGNGLVSLPESIGKLTDLQWLFLNANGLTSLPESIGRLTNLRMLTLRSNNLTSLPESIGQLTNLQSLYLEGYFSDVKLTTLPESFGQLNNLRLLELRYNQLTTLPESFGQLTNLETLYVENNQLTTLPESFGQLTNLKTLYIENNQLTTLPESIGQLTNLKYLYLRENKLTNIPESIANLKDNLNYLDLHNNPISQEEANRLRLWLPYTLIIF